jgi:Domain of unknown function (DUF4351)
LLASWKISLDITGQVAEAEQEFIMALSQAYLEWEQQTEQQGLQQGLQRERSLVVRQLNRRVGVEPKDLETQISSLTLDELEGLGNALLDFTSFSDLEVWLQSHSPSL